MNKKIIVIVLVIVAILVGVIVSVNINNKEDENNTNEISNSNEEVLNNENLEENSNIEETKDKKILVAFFSKAGENYALGDVEVGNTEIMANNIKEMTGADIFKIEPVEDYPEGYNDTTKVAKEEQAEDSRPEIKNKIENIDQYDTIFIGYPIWWGDMPQIIYTFLESYNFDGKTIIPFNTHAGSGNAGTYEKIKEKLPNSKVLDGLAISGTDARKESSKTTIRNWLDKLGY